MLVAFTNVSQKNNGMLMFPNKSFRDGTALRVTQAPTVPAKNRRNPWQALMLGPAVKKYCFTYCVSWPCTRFHESAMQPDCSSFRLLFSHPRAPFPIENYHPSWVPDLDSPLCFVCSSASYSVLLPLSVRALPRGVYSVWASSLSHLEISCATSFSSRVVALLHLPQDNQDPCLRNRLTSLRWNNWNKQIPGSASLIATPLLGYMISAIRSFIMCALMGLYVRNLPTRHRDRSHQYPSVLQYGSPSHLRLRPFLQPVNVLPYPRYR
ncbi:unnamed protein product [Sphenostylis stenocarpa]|uniref:Uncharacterized protein n=1 Tax=Sphenostylis stenocarpa TaxID=92480 RepID=A0AA86SGX3_9FABA|nr:unnamed protein product [Sphenostylis stenocarpa]